MSPKVDFSTLKKFRFANDDANMARRKKQLGKGAVVAVLGKMLHPSEHIRNKYPNMEKGFRVENLVVLRKELKKIRGKEVMTIVMRHDDFRDATNEFILLHCIERYCVVRQEGEADYFFEKENTGPVDIAQEEVCEEEMPAEIQAMALLPYLTADDAYLARQLIQTDDDNDPAPENIPGPILEGQEPEQNNNQQQWGHSGVCPRP